MLDTILQYLMPIVVAAVVAGAMGLLKKVSAWVDAQSDTIKRIILGAIALVASVVAKLIHVELPADLLHMDAGLLSTLVSAAVTALVAHFVHKGTAAVTS